jgi:hypothetical protein
MKVGRYTGHYAHFVETSDWKALLKFGISLLLWSTASLSHSQDYTFTLKLVTYWLAASYKVFLEKMAVAYIFETFPTFPGFMKPWTSPYSQNPSTGSHLYPFFMESTASYPISLRCVLILSSQVVSSPDGFFKNI